MQYVQHYRRLRKMNRFLLFHYFLTSTRKGSFWHQLTDTNREKRMLKRRQSEPVTKKTWKYKRTRKETKLKLMKDKL